MRKKVDAVVIGAGIAGTSIAFQLAHRGMTNIVVVEKQDIGSGATGESYARFRTHDMYPERAALERLTYQIYFQKWEEIIGTKFAFHWNKLIQIIGTGDIDKAKKNVETFREAGFKNEIISAEEIKRWQPYMNVDDVAIAVYEPETGYGDGYLTASDFMMKARDLGAELVRGIPVTAIKEQAGQIVGVETPEGIIESPIVVLAASGWSKSLAATIGVELPIQPVWFAMQVANLPPGMMAEDLMIVADFIKGVFWRPEGRRMVIMGDLLYRQEIDPDSYSRWVPDETRIKWLEKITQRAPIFQNAPLRRIMGGVCAVTPDENPLLGSVPGIRGLYLDTGFSIVGWCQAPGAAVLLAELILDGEVKSVKKDFFNRWRVTRFAENQPIPPTTAYEAHM